MLKRSNKHLFFFTLTLFLIVPVSVPAQSRIESLTATPISPESIFHFIQDKPASVSNAPSAGKKGLISVIVKLRGESLVSYRGGIPGLSPTASSDLTARLDVKSSEAQAYLRYLDAKHSTFETAARQVIPQLGVTHRFNVVLNGLSMLVPADQVKTLAVLPGVEAVYMDELLRTQTDSSPLFIGATTLWQRFGGEESAGEDVIVGILDTGIWPEHPSFSDPDPSGKPYGILSSWNGTSCQFGSAVPGDAAFSCNNKLLGAIRIMTTYDAYNSLLPGEFLSARDDDGHGTHTSSTAAGNATVPASIFGTSWGDISGIAPRARVAMYKVCGDTGCYSSDSAAAVQQAILDGVNVINFSISGGSNPYTDVVSLAFRDAYAAGVFVAASAGNSGPQPDTVDHHEPWVTTIAASTQIRAFVNEAELTADGGAVLTLSGTSVTGGTTSPKTIVVPLADELCLDPFSPGSVTDQVVVCKRGTNSRVAKGYNVLQGGAAGMILYNASANQDLDTDNHFLPATHIQYEDGQALLSFIGAHSNVLVTLTDSYKTESQGDVMASFSSRGGVGQTLGISKPDITAPGVQILAGHTPLPATMDGGHPGELFQAIQGTSMSSPHIAGAAALLKALRPRWTPGQIKSALMMTAKTTEVVKEDGSTPADPFDFGSGRVDLSAAGRAWLTMDATAEDYVTHQDDLWNANYPSVYIPSMPGILTVKRKVHNELASSFSMRLRVSAPSDVKITVPAQISLISKGNAKLTIKVDARNVPIGETRTATISMIKGASSPVLHIPITFVRRQAVVELTKSCDPAEFTKGSTTTCTITMTNSTFSDATVNMTDKVPGKLKLIARSVTGATSVYENTLKFRGTLTAAQPPDVMIGAGSSPYGYIPLSSYGIPPIVNMGDESIANYSTEAFTYAGESYTGLGVVSNGYVVVGGGTSSDVRYLNQNLPNSGQPNNVLAPFWTDLNPGAAGGVRIAYLTDDVDTWIVIDWEGVKEYSTPNTASFQVWIGIDGDTNPGEDISYAYGTIQGNGDLGLLTVGAENKFGNRGGNYYYNGVGSLPANGTQLRVTGTPGVPGGTHVLSFSAKGILVGDWTNYATMTSDQYQGTNIAPMSGKVLP